MDRDHLFFLFFLSFFQSADISSVQYCWTLTARGSLPLPYFLAGSSSSTSGAELSSSILQAFLFCICYTRLRTSFTFVLPLAFGPPRWLRSSLWNTSSQSLSSILTLEYKQFILAQQITKCAQPLQIHGGIFAQDGRPYFRRIIQIQQGSDRMRHGHRRTQSANLNCHAPQSTVEKPLFAQQRHQIISLLDRCQTKVEHKVCTVDLLNSPLPSQQTELFNFGKGLMKGSLQQRDRTKKYDHIVSIPEKQNPVGKIKRTGNAAVRSRNKQRERQPVVQARMSEAERREMFFTESINRIMRPKVGSLAESKPKKSTLYENGLIKNVRLGKYRKET